MSRRWPHVVNVAVLLFLAGCLKLGGPTSPSGGRSATFTPDDGVRLQGAQPAPVIVNGTTYVYVSTGVDGTAVPQSSDGLTFTSNAPAAYPAGFSRTIVSLGDGRFRMYYFPDATSVEIRSAISSNGLNWTVEAGVRYSEPNIGGVRATALPAGGYRLYFLTTTGLGSAMSSDGLTFVGEGPVTTNPASDGSFSWGPSAAIFLDGAFHMVLTKNLSTTSELWHATSSDGRTFTVDKDVLAVNPGVPINQPAWWVNAGVRRIYYRAQPPGGTNAVASGIIRF